MNMRTSRLHAFVAAMLLFAGCQLANAEDVNIGGISYELNEGDMTATVARNSEAAGEIVLPTTLSHNGKTYTLTTIGEAAFEYCEDLTAITIPESVTAIGDDAFTACTGLRSMVVASGNKVYDSREGCNAIIKTATGQLLFGCNASTFPAGVTAIADEAFYKCYDLDSAILPEGVTTIGDYAFYKCDGLRTVSLPTTLTTIGESAFSDCFRVGSILLPEGLVTIGESAFYDMDALGSVRIPASVSSIGTDAFGYCINLKSIAVEEGNRVYDSRESCNAIIETATNTLIVGCQASTIPATVTAIGQNAFTNANGLTSVTLHEKLASVGFMAFSQCEALTTVTITSDATTINGFAFEGCNNLKDVYCYGKEMNQAQPNAFAGIPGSVTLHVHAPLIEAYRQAEEWGGHFGSIVPLPGEEVDGIGQVKANNNAAVSIFTIDGRKLPAMQKGVNILKTKDGRCVKVAR